MNAEPGIMSAATMRILRQCVLCWTPLCDWGGATSEDAARAGAEGAPGQALVLPAAARVRPRGGPAGRAAGAAAHGAGWCESWQRLRAEHALSARPHLALCRTLGAPLAVNATSYRALCFSPFGNCLCIVFCNLFSSCMQASCSSEMEYGVFPALPINV